MAGCLHGHQSDVRVGTQRSRFAAVKTPETVLRNDADRSVRITLASGHREMDQTRESVAFAAVERMFVNIKIVFIC